MNKIDLDYEKFKENERLELFLLDFSLKLVSELALGLKFEELKQFIKKFVKEM